MFDIEIVENPAGAGTKSVENPHFPHNVYFGFFRAKTTFL
jgi:hypothetical protein